MAPVKRLRTHMLLSNPDVESLPIWQKAIEDIDRAITAIVWPTTDAAHTTFTINPTRKGNGVKPIKKAFQVSLEQDGWKLEQRKVLGSGPLDGLLTMDNSAVAVEWETGNISSSHRSLNRMCMGMIQDVIVGGILVLPSARLYPFLTDRIGSFGELQPYFPIWEKVAVVGTLAVIEVEQDAEDTSVPLIPKGTDGWALVQRPLSSADQ